VDRARFLGLELTAGALAGAQGVVTPRPVLRRLPRPTILPAAVAAPSGDPSDPAVAVAA
jgi:hypothetical protein